MGLWQVLSECEGGIHCIVSAIEPWVALIIVLLNCLVLFFIGFRKVKRQLLYDQIFTNVVEAVRNLTGIILQKTRDGTKQTEAKTKEGGLKEAKGKDIVKRPK